MQPFDGLEINVLQLYSPVACFKKRRFLLFKLNYLLWLVLFSIT